MTPTSPHVTLVMKGVFMTKICSKCKWKLDIEAFGWKSQSGGIRRSDCKQCHAMHKRVVRAAAQIPASERRMGLSELAWTRLFESQNRRCVICKVRKKPPNGWIVDKNEQGKQAVLCWQCYLGLKCLITEKSLMAAAAFSLAS